MTVTASPVTDGGTRATCGLCGHHRSTLVGTKREMQRTRSVLRVHRCEACGVAFLAKRPEDFDANLYDYYAKRVGRSRDELYDPLTSERYRVLLSAWMARTSGRRLLDVGCGQGQFLQSASSVGWIARGIDLSASAIAICQSFGLPAERLDFFAPELSSERFDVITMFELIEHVPSPPAFVARASELLHPGGLLYLTTPNFAGLDRRILGMAWEPIHGEHVWYFDPSTLRALVGEHFEVVKTTAHHVSARALRALPSSFLDKVLGGRPRASSERAAVAPSEEEVKGLHEQEAALRHRLERSAPLRAAKRLVNGALDRAGLGSALTLLAKKRG